MKTKILFLICFLCYLNTFSQEEEKTNYINKHFDPSYFPNGISNINLYVNTSCGRCENIVNILNNDSIKFNKLEISDPKIDEELKIKIYKATPYKNLATATHYPVFEIDTVVFYCIENHVTFTNDLIKYLKSFNKIKKAE